MSGIEWNLEDFSENLSKNDTLTEKNSKYLGKNIYLLLFLKIILSAVM